MTSDDMMDFIEEFVGHDHDGDGHFDVSLRSGWEIGLEKAMRGRCPVCRVKTGENHHGSCGNQNALHPEGRVWRGSSGTFSDFAIEQLVAKDADIQQLMEKIGKWRKIAADLHACYDMLMPGARHIAIQDYELLNMASVNYLQAAAIKKVRKLNLPDIEDPPGCPSCGAIAGACSAYPNCPGNPDHLV